MNSRRTWLRAGLCAGVWLLVACGDADDSAETTSPMGGGWGAVPEPAGAMAPPVTSPPGAEAGSAGTAIAGTVAAVGGTGGSGGMNGTEPPVGGVAAPPQGGDGGGESMPPEDPSGPLLPIIPPVMGDCPTFTSGTKTIMGLSGISFQVGAKVTGPPTGALVFYWHGTGSTAAEGNRFPGIRELMSTGGVFVAFSGSTRSGGDCSGTGTFSHDDFKIADHIVACAVRDHNIDARRIYATGCSAGGLFSGCMAIERSSYLAAAVPNSGGITIGYGPIQDPTRVPAVMTMHGGPGDMVFVTFSQTSQAYASYMLKKGSPMVINCDHGGRHCGAPAALYESGWQFMKDHPFGTELSPYQGGLPAGFHSSCEIWTDDSLTPLGRDPTGEPKTPVTGTPWMPPTP